MIGPPDAIARAVLAHHPLAVALAILHIEWMTQRHYLESVQDDQELDPQFKSLLRHHWMEEAQHAKLDTLMVEALAETCDAAEIERAFEEYLEIGGMIDGGLAAAGRASTCEPSSARPAASSTTPSEEAFTTVQRQAKRWTYLGSGMTHRNFLATVGALRPAARTKIEQIAPAFR